MTSYPTVPSSFALLSFQSHFVAVERFRVIVDVSIAWTVNSLYIKIYYI